MSKKESNGTLSEKSKQDLAVEQLRERLQDIIKPEHDDHILTKWLKARNFNVDKAEAMFRASMAYREKMRIDYILEEYEPPEVIKQYLGGGICGHDKNGSPVCIEPFGNLDIKGLMCSAKKSDLERSKIYLQEQVLVDCAKQTEKLGKRIDKTTVIMDMENVGSEWFWKPGMQMYTSLIQILEDNYPEMVNSMFVVNAPRIFPMLFKLIKPLLSEDMTQKVHVFGSDYKTQLLKYIDADELPKYLGGSMVDPDGNERCPSKVCSGGKVPKSFYLKEVAASGTMTSITINRGEKYKVDFVVDKPSSMIRWEIKTDDYDIGFSVHRQKGKKTVEVRPTTRLQSHVMLEDGSYICEEPGTYVIIFDNSYSWTKSKHLHYLLELHTADMDDQTVIDAFSQRGSWTRLVKDKQITHL